MQFTAFCLGLWGLIGLGIKDKIVYNGEMVVVLKPMQTNVVFIELQKKLYLFYQYLTKNGQIWTIIGLKYMQFTVFCLGLQY